MKSIWNHKSIPVPILNIDDFGVAACSISKTKIYQLGLSFLSDVSVGSGQFLQQEWKSATFSDQKQIKQILRIIERIGRQDQTTGLWQRSWYAFHTPLESNCVDVGTGHAVRFDVALKMWDYLW